jgi:hypothetical protein
MHALLPLISTASPPLTPYQLPTDTVPKDQLSNLGSFALSIVALCLTAATLFIAYLQLRHQVRWSVSLFKWPTEAVADGETVASSSEDIERPFGESFIQCWTAPSHVL